MHIWQLDATAQLRRELVDNRREWVCGLQAQAAEATAKRDLATLYRLIRQLREAPWQPDMPM
eukprot:10135952-Lingulodinium_polyedra.AAC.1